MKNKTPCITLLGNNSGRNLGDAAILSSIMEDLSKKIPGVKFLVPSIAPKWIAKHYGDKYNVKAVDVMPWTLSLRLLGLPTILCFLKSDAALICDGIIFGKKLFNPAFNYLITLFFLAPLAKLCKCKLVCFNCGIGPFPSKISERMARYLMDSCDLITLRERDSLALAEEIGVKHEIKITGDSAFINPVSGKERGIDILKEKGVDSTKLLGVNVTSYLDTWLTKEEQVAEGTDIIEVIASGVNKALEDLAKAGEEKVTPVVFCTQPMDLDTSKRLAEMLSAVVVDNSTYLSHDIQAVMRECGLFVGMRFHSLILASAVEAPILGLIYAPKVRGYLRLLGCADYGLELAALSKESLANKIVSAWRERADIQQKQKEIIDGLKVGAASATEMLKQCIEA